MIAILDHQKKSVTHPLEKDNIKVINPSFTSSIDELKKRIQPTIRPDLLQPPLKKIQFTSTSSDSSNEALKSTQKRLIELGQEDEDDEYGIVKLNVYAFDKPWSFITEASQFLKDSYRKASVSTDNEALKITQKRLIELWQEDEDDEYGIVKPTVYAFDKAWSFITEASQFLKDSFRKASVSTDDEGGIRLTWTKVEPEAEVRLVCPCGAHKEVYLYHEKDSQYNIVQNITAFDLASWLDWLNKV